MSRFGSRTRVSTAISGWMPTGDEPVPTTNFLVVAGGGGASGNIGGGGGGGGMRCSVTASGGSPGTVEVTVSNSYRHYIYRNGWRWWRWW